MSRQVARLLKALAEQEKQTQKFVKGTVKLALDVQALTARAEAAEAIVVTNQTLIADLEAVAQTGARNLLAAEAEIIKLRTRMARIETEMGREKPGAA